MLGWGTLETNIVFYAEKGHIAGRNPIWVHTMLMTVVIMFDIVELHKNLGKTKEMVCIPGFIRGKQGLSEYKRRATGEGDTFR